MLLANHVSEKLEITNPNNKFDCWVQEKRVLADLIRNNLNNEVPLVYLPIMVAPQVSEINTSVSISSNPQIYLPSTVEMGSVAMPQQIPTQATKPKSKRTKSKKPTFVASQKTTVEITTITPVGSEQRGVTGEGRGENQQNPQDKVR